MMLNDFQHLDRHGRWCHLFISVMRVTLSALACFLCSEGQAGLFAGFLWTPFMFLLRIRSASREEESRHIGHKITDFLTDFSW